jgi:hypothetical protein
MANDYLVCRERYKICYHRWDNYARQLCELWSCSFADIEDQILQARTERRHLAEIAEYARLSNMLDVASDAWDAAQQRILRRDLELIDC